MFDEFLISSSGIIFKAGANHYPSLSRKTEEKNQSGTLVLLKLSNTAKRSAKAIFDEYASPEADNDYNFSKTIVPIELAQHEGAMLISRSQAKRILMRLENFKNVVLDFHGVTEIGQAFADEIFRVFPASHPNVNFFPVSANAEIIKMILRANPKQKINIEN